MLSVPMAEAGKAKYVRVGISQQDDAILDRLADGAFKGALKKADVGRLLLEYALSHYGDVIDWYKKRGLDVLKSRP